MGYKGNIGLNHEKKLPLVEDLYRSTVVTGNNIKTRPTSAVPHTAHRGPCNQYGENRIISGGKGKK
jgi:hypothetical protein